MKKLTQKEQIAVRQDFTKGEIVQDEKALASAIVKCIMSSVSEHEKETRHAKN